MKFKTTSKELSAAIDVVSCVKPTLPAKSPGFLFSVADNKCSVYSRDGSSVSRTVFAVESEGEEDFLYPVEGVTAFKYLNGEITVETKAAESSTIVQYTTPGGASAERSTMSTHFLTKCDEDMKDAKTAHEFSASVLQFALNTVRPFMPKDDANVHEYLKTIQIFDASKPEWEAGNGVLFVADGVRATYFECDAFKDKLFHLPAKQVGLLSSFLGKCAGEKVVVRNAEATTFVEAPTGNVLGVQRSTASHQKYAYYPLEKDMFSFRVSKDEILAALRLVRAELDKKRDLIRMSYSKGVFTFTAKDSSSRANTMPVKPISVDVSEKNSRDFTTGLNVDHFIQLFDSAQCNEIELRVALVPREGKDVALLRTIENFLLDNNGKVTCEKTPDTYACKVTRFMSSKD